MAAGEGACASHYLPLATYYLLLTRPQVSDPKRIASHYLRGWFTLDLVSILPFQVVGLIVGGEISKLKVMFPCYVLATHYFLLTTHYSLTTCDPLLATHYLLLYLLIVGVGSPNERCTFCSVIVRVPCIDCLLSDLTC